jgi:hypothetical protein
MTVMHSPVEPEDAVRDAIRTSAAAIPPRDLRALVSQVSMAQRATFEAELQRYVERTVAGVEVAVLRALRRVRMQQRAREQAASEPWQPPASDLQRGRMSMLAEFNRPGNLPIQRFALLAGKSRQQIYKDIADRKLLAIDVGVRGKRLPEWQLQDAPRVLTQTVLRLAPTVDEWTVYSALSEPGAVFHGTTAVARVTPASVEKTAARVLNALGVH